MLAPLLFVIALTFTRSYANPTENLAQKKATLEAKASTEREEVLRWNELSQSSQCKFATAKRQLMALHTDLRISQDELLAASNRVHCAQNKLAELDQLSCQLKNKLDEEYQRKIVQERNINMRTARKRKRNTRQAPYPWSDPPIQSHAANLHAAPLPNDRSTYANHKPEPRSAPPNAAPDPRPSLAVKQGFDKVSMPAQQGNQMEFESDLDLSKLSDIELLRKSLDPIYRQTIDSLARQVEVSKKEVAARPREAAVSGYANVSAPSAGATNAATATAPQPRMDKAEKPASPRSGCEHKEQEEMSALRKVKLEIFQDEALLRNVEDQLESARTLFSAEQNRLDEISRRICGIRYDLKDAEREARERLDALQQAQCQAAAHQDLLTDITKQLQAVIAEMTRKEMDELTKRTSNSEQTVARRRVTT